MCVGKLVVDTRTILCASNTVLSVRVRFSLSRLPELTELGSRDQLAHDVVSDNELISVGVFAWQAKRVKFAREILSHSHSSQGSVTQSR